MSIEAEMQRVIDEHAIERLLKSYNRCHDDRRTADLVELFTIDARLRVMGKEVVGKEALSELFGPAHAA